MKTILEKSGNFVRGKKYFHCPLRISLFNDNIDRRGTLTIYVDKPYLYACVCAVCVRACVCVPSRVVFTSSGCDV